MSTTESKVFENGEVLVTTTRFVVNGQTYAMNGVTSVKSYKKDPSRVLPVIIGIAGLITLFSGFASGSTAASIFGLVILAGAYFLWKSQKPEYSVRLATASGEASALNSNDNVYINQVVEALNNAIIQRG